MKVRHGFVSNSSSTSFCIYGVRLEECYDPQEYENFEETEGGKLYKYVENNVALLPARATYNNEQVLADYKENFEEAYYDFDSILTDILFVKTGYRWEAHRLEEEQDIIYLGISPREWKEEDSRSGITEMINNLQKEIGLDNTPDFYEE